MRLGALAAVMTLSACGSGEAPPLTIAAAANLESVLPRLTETFEQETGTRAVISFGATRVLGQQIENGAPFDLFLSADTAEVDRLIGLGRIEKDSRRVYARGVLALWSPSGEATSLEDLRGARSVAMAKPEFAPYGRAAREALEKAGLWEEIEPKVVYGQNVRVARQFAESGNADAALIALSLTEALPGKVTEVAADSYSPIEQGAGVVSGSARIPEALSFGRWLAESEARDLLVDSGYR